MRKISTTFTQYRQNVSNEELKLLTDRLAADPGNYDLMDWAAFAYYSHGQTEAAIETYQKLLAKFPENASYHYYLGNTLYRKGEVEAAKAHWNRVLGLDDTGGFADRAKRKLSNLKAEP